MRALWVGGENLSTGESWGADRGPVAESRNQPCFGQAEEHTQDSSERRREDMISSEIQWFWGSCELGGMGCRQREDDPFAEQMPAC